MLFALKAYMNWQSSEEICLQISLSHLCVNLRYTQKNKTHIFTIHTLSDVKLSISKLHPSKNNITGRGIGKSFRCWFKNAAKNMSIERQ